MKQEVKPEGRVVVEVMIEGKTWMEDLTAQTEIHLDLDTLNRALSLHPGRYAMWASMEARARHSFRMWQQKLAEFDRKVREVEGKLYLKYSAPQPGTTKAPTVEAIKASIASDPLQQKAEEKRAEVLGELENAQYAADQLLVGRKTMRDTKDVLMEIARNFREEMNAGMMPGVKAPPGVRGLSVAVMQKREQEALEEQQRRSKK